MFNPTFVGRLVADPELKTRKVKSPVTGELADTSVVNIRVAVDDGFRRDAEGKKIGTEFYDCAFFRGAAETIAKYGAKGRVIAIKGTIHHREWYDSTTGEKRFSLTVPSVDGYEFFGPAPAAAAKEEAAEMAVTDVASVDMETPWDN